MNPTLKRLSVEDVNDINYTQGCAEADKELSEKIGRRNGGLWVGS